MLKRTFRIVSKDVSDIQVYWDDEYNRLILEQTDGTIIWFPLDEVANVLDAIQSVAADQTNLSQQAAP